MWKMRRVAWLPGQRIFVQLILDLTLRGQRPYRAPCFFDIAVSPRKGEIRLHSGQMRPHPISLPYRAHVGREEDQEGRE